VSTFFRTSHIRDSENPPDSADDCNLSVNASRSSAVIKFTGADSAMRAFYFLRWVNKHGQAGPWSPMAHALIS
jgi:hypothetical protein